MSTEAIIKQSHRQHVHYLLKRLSDQKALTLISTNYAPDSYSGRFVTHYINSTTNSHCTTIYLHIRKKYICKYETRTKTKIPHKQENKIFRILKVRDDNKIVSMLIKLYEFKNTENSFTFIWCLIRKNMKKFQTINL